jgi:hypothetical protein
MTTTVRITRIGDDLIVTRSDGDTLPLGGPRAVVPYLSTLTERDNLVRAAEHFGNVLLGMSWPLTTVERSTRNNRTAVLTLTDTTED